MTFVRRIVPAAVVLGVTLMLGATVSLVDSATGANGGGTAVVAMNNGWD